jgi:hypothetical protein
MRYVDAKFSADGETLYTFDRTRSWSLEDTAQADRRDPS